jgi:SAM-dependent methyltransferase
MTGATSTAPVALLRGSCGTPFVPPSNRWASPADPSERALVAHVIPPVLDIGCGPGRHVVALAEQGVPVLGIDVCDHALDLARSQGAPVLHRSVFDRVPGSGRWGSALLLDGNIGIGAAPADLLRRVVELVRPGGRLIVELDPPGSSSAIRRVRLEIQSAGDGDARPSRPQVEVGPWFDWCALPVDLAGETADKAGLSLVETWNEGDRILAVLEAPGRSRDHDSGVVRR